MRFPEPCPGDIASAKATGGGYTTMNVHNITVLTFQILSAFLLLCFRAASADLLMGNSVCCFTNKEAI